MENIDIAKKIIELLGGDEGLTRLKAKHIETVPLGLRFVVARENPGNFSVKVILSHARYDVEIAGSLLRGQHRFEALQDWELVELFRTVEWAAK